MIPGSESCIKATTWGLVFCVILALPACSDDAPVEKIETEPTTDQEPLPVREWYPRQKSSAPQSQFTYQGSQPQMMQPPVYSNSQPAQQQTRESAYQVYQAPPVIIVQPQSQWYGTGVPGQAPAQQTTVPQQYVNPYYNQAPQRPWGEVPQGVQGKQQSYTTPSAGYQQVNPWSGWQPPGSAVYPGWGTPYGGYPGAAPGSVW